MQVLCGQCGKTLTVADALAGGVLPCPECRHRITLPTLGLAFETTSPFDAQGTPSDTPGTSADVRGTPSADRPLSGGPGGESGPGGPDGFADLARQTVSRKVHVECTVCHKSLSLGGRLWGTKIKCPSCGMSLHVPHPDERQDNEFIPRRRAAEPVDEPPPFEPPPFDLSITGEDMDFLADPAPFDGSWAPPPSDDAPVPPKETPGTLAAESAGALAEVGESSLADLSQLSDQLRFDDDPPARVEGVSPARDAGILPARSGEAGLTSHSHQAHGTHHAGGTSASRAAAAVPEIGAAPETGEETATETVVESPDAAEAAEPDPFTALDADAAPQPRPARRPRRPRTPAAAKRARRQARAQRKGVPVWVFYTVVGVLAVVLALLTPRLLEFLSGSGVDVANPSGNSADNGADNRTGHVAGVSSNVAARNTGNAGGGTTGGETRVAPPSNVAASAVNAAGGPSDSSPPPSASGATLAIAQARRDVFLANGYNAAPLGRWHLKLRVEIQAGRQAVTLSPTTVTLTGGAGGPAVCRGFEPPVGRLPAGPVITPQTLEPGKKQSFTLVFDVPRTFDSGRLEWPDVGEAGVMLSPESGRWEGQWSERPPRNLRPLPADPAQALLQQTAGLQLTVYRQGEQYDVQLLPLNLRAQASRTPQGDLHVEFRLDNHPPVPVTLRLADGGRTLVLYVVDAPFGQITFGRQ